MIISEANMFGSVTLKIGRKEEDLHDGEWPQEHL